MSGLRAGDVVQKRRHDEEGLQKGRTVRGAGAATRGKRLAGLHSAIPAKQHAPLQVLGTS